MSTSANSKPSPHVESIDGDAITKPRLIHRLRGQSAVALVDQAITSGANFATVVIVGRAAGADALGIYSLGFTLLMLVGAAQESLVSSPYTFYGHRADDRQRSVLAGSALVHAFGLMVLGMLALAVLAGVLGDSPLADVMWTFAAMTPLLLAREFGRKFAFADLRMHVALALDLATAVIQVGGLLWLAHTDHLTATTAVLAAGLACGVAGLGWLVVDRNCFQIDRRQVLNDWRRHWRFGRWVFAGVVTILFHINVIRWLIAFGIDNAAAGVFAACMAIAMLSSPFIQGMNNVLMPRAAKAFHNQGRSAVRRVVWQTTTLILSGMAAFVLLTFGWGGWAVTQIYGQDYAGNHTLICVLVLFMVSRAVDTSLYNGIWALERPEANVRINLIAVSATVLLATTMMSFWGVLGAACGLLVGDLCGTGLRGWSFLSLAADADEYKPSLHWEAE